MLITYLKSRSLQLTVTWRFEKREGRDIPCVPCDLSCLSIDGNNDTLLQNEIEIIMAALSQGYRCEH